MDRPTDYGILQRNMPQFEEQWINIDLKWNGGLF